MAKSKNRLILFGIVILVVACVAAPTYFAVRNYYYKQRFSEMLFEAIEKDPSLLDEISLDFTHSSSEIVGQLKDRDAESNFNFVNSGLHLLIPDGTRMDQHDNAWGNVWCCSTFPAESDFPVLPESTFSIRKRTGTQPIVFPMLTEPNRDVPEDVTIYDITVPNDPYMKMAFSHPESNRLWVNYGYRPPTD